ncbi:MAG: FecR domain-containing protein [Candidatus Dactylopiibacterium sp.]|nr:FecR domain-containing protein [Candidatus Dactylopiibacterium sp.]
MRRGLVRLGALLALAGAGAGPAAAQDFLAYRVQPGDTLYALAARYLDDAAGWRLLARVNRLRDPHHLTPGTTLRLPYDALRGEALTLAVDSLRGEAFLTTAAGERRALATDDRPGEGDLIEVGATGHVRLRLQDGSTLQLPAGAWLRLQHLREVSAADLSRTVVHLERGRVDSQVRPQREGSRFEVVTPLASTGVRGTRFGVALPAAGRMVSDVSEGHVVVAGLRDGQAADVRGGQGAVVSAAGAVDVRALPAAPVPERWPERIEQLPATLPVRPDAGIAGWQVEVAEDAALERAMLTLEGPQPTLAGVPDGHYFVGVRGLDRDGLPGPFVVRPVRVKTMPLPPLVQSPAGGVVVALGDTVLQCTDVPGVAGYVLQLAEDRDFAHPRQIRQRGPDCRFTVAVGRERDHFWRVASIAPDEIETGERGPFSVAAHFVARARPRMPEPESEHDGRSVRVFWAGEAHMRFVLEVSAAADDAPALVRQEVAAPQAVFELPPRCAPYFVRLRAVSPDGLESAFSPPRVLRTPPVVCDGSGEAVQTNSRTLSRDP